MTPILSPLFVPHGAPTFALQPGAAGAALRTLAAGLQRPRALLVISAHWASTPVTVGFAEQPATIHDFWGFPEALYALRYPASGCPQASAEVVVALQAVGMPVAVDTERGLDHGAWVPLHLMFPEAEIPVIPLSLPSAGGPQAAWQLGQALAPLTRQGFQIIASGNLTHNLRDYQRAAMTGGETPSYVRSFTDWFAERLAAHDLAALLDYRRQAPAAVQAHPSEEHLLPLFVALGAAGSAPETRRLHAGIADYVIAMDAYAFLPADNGRPQIS